MFRLILLRHAKSSREQSGLPDFDRPLNEHGRAAARLMAAAMVERGFIPGRTLCSAAARTRETFAAVSPRLGMNPDVLFTRDLYEPPFRDYRPLIAAHAGDARVLLVIAHNPIIQATALALAGSGDRSLVEAVERKFPTAAVAVLDFPDGTTWKTLAPHDGELVAFLTPADLGGHPED